LSTTSPAPSHPANMAVTHTFQVCASGYSSVPLGPGCRGRPKFYTLRAHGADETSAFFCQRRPSSPCPCPVRAVSKTFQTRSTSSTASPRSRPTSKTSSSLSKAPVRAPVICAAPMLTVTCYESRPLGHCRSHRGHGARCDSTRFWRFQRYVGYPYAWALVAPHGRLALEGQAEPQGLPTTSHHPLNSAR
jgi:hypothetical protein